MPISYSENATLTCPSCGLDFESTIWMLVDAAEQPELAHALREGQLNVVTCPHCGNQGPAGAPLLYHDPANRRVYFAAPPDTEEHEWREQAQSLLYLLVDNLPEEARRPYLGDVQVEQTVEGVRRAILRRHGTQKTASSDPVQKIDPTPPAHGAEHRVVEPPPPPPSSADVPPIFAAVQALIAANSPDEFTAIIDEHPVLLDDSADAALLQLTEAAYAQGERDVAAALQQARATLAELRATLNNAAGLTAASLPAAVAGDHAAAAGSQSRLSEPAYQALLRATSPDDLIEAVRDHPALLETWADAELGARAEAALDEGNERLAQGIEERREILAELRAELTSQAPLTQAIEALLQAKDEDTLAEVLTEYPILLTDAAQDALFSFAASARARGDEHVASYAAECQAMLRKVRAGLEQG